MKRSFKVRVIRLQVLIIVTVAVRNDHIVLQN